MDERLTLFSSEDEAEPKFKLNNNIASTKSDIPWVEKYRPKKLDDIVDHVDIIKILKNSIQTGELPHLLLHGSPGTGKTSTILAIARELFGPIKIKERVIELNASDDRGIQSVRNKIITFAKMSFSSKDPNYPCPNFKIVILDEADAMTADAQSALRKVMESTSKITRFCFICNYVNQIIDPIASRCTRLKFKPIKKEHIFKKVQYIAQSESVIISDECLNTLIDMSNNDARRVIMNLQNLQYIIKYKKNVSNDDILQMNGQIDTKKFGDILKICLNGNIDDIKKLTNDLCREGFTVKSILKHFMESVLNSTMSDKMKSIIFIELSNTDKKMSEGCNEYLQLLNIFMFVNVNLLCK